VDPQLVIDKRQARVNRWLKRWRMASKQILQLAQQYTPEMTVGRVAGLIAKPFDISREAIAGQFDLIVSYDARYGSPEFVFNLLKNLNQYLVTLDTNAVINRDEVIRYAMASLDPTLADLAVRDSENASQQEIEDELRNFTMMFARVQPPMKLGGQNHAARLQVLQSQLQGNPRYQQLLGIWPDFGEIVQQRIDFLTQQVNQQKNRVIGVFGTSPSMGSDAGAGGVPQIGNFGG
jgi:hypothetical protein